MPDYEEFKGEMPYASEVFGVFQPLLGWKSNHKMERIVREQENNIGTLIDSMMFDSRLQDNMNIEDPRVISPDQDIALRPPAWMDPDLFSYLRHEVEKILQNDKDKPLTQQKWENIFSDQNLAKGLCWKNTADSATMMDPNPGLSPYFQKDLPKGLIIAGVMQWLSKNSPHLLHNLFQINSKPWETQRNFLDPLADIDALTRLAVLSPIGIINSFREYFFEFNTFLGPPVGHVWISPGSVIELIEVNSRRTVTEQMVDILLENNEKNELSTTKQEDLYDAVTRENHSNVKLGINAGAGGSEVIYPAEASDHIGYDSSLKLAWETCHKYLRRQSEKLSREIRRNFKTTFRTSTEIHDTSSRRHVVENKTGKLLNFELRRKMRKVGVQVQHIGTQLCWQVNINEPGKDLGIAELVHFANPTSLTPPPLDISQILSAKENQNIELYSDYVEAVRKRIKSASNIKKRNSSDMRDEERAVTYQRLLRQLLKSGANQNVHITSEMLRSIFDVDKMICFFAPDWWKPRDYSRILPEQDRPTYFITEEAEPARFGSSLGWLLQLDGDNHRNAFLNSPWVKAVIPIRPGRETAAINWLKLAHVEGTEGLDAQYCGPEPELKGKTIGEALQILVTKVSILNTEIKHTLQGETVFENGFTPLERGFQATGTPFEVFDQWVEDLPTDQIVALEYDVNLG
ncbi:MAG: hypothetical protein ACYCX4_08085 [Bacillota bacterium]